MGAALRRRLRSEDGFTMIIALGVMLVTSLMCAAAFLAVESDARNVGRDLQAKQAYAAAQAGVQAYLYQLNENSETGWWETCSHDTQAAQTVPGATTGVTYSWAPVTTCVSSDPVGSLIDSAGNLRIKFTGTAGTGTSAVTRTIVASFTTSSPLSYLWYTVHETLDPAAEPACTGDPFFYNQVSSGVTIPYNCRSQWTGGDKINGPLYTQDQLNINPSSNPGPSFQNVTSDAPSTDPNAVCVASNCYNATFLSKQTVEGGGQAVPFPTDNASLLADAQKSPQLALPGTVNVVLNGATATVVNCPTASSCTTRTNVNLSTTQLIYASNGAGCNTTYNPSDVTYAFTSAGYAYGPCGDIYVSGSYSTSLTLAAANDIVIAPNPLNTSAVFGVTAANDLDGQTAPTGTATLGLVADEYVRIYHPASFAANATSCTGGSAANPNVTIDAAVLTLQHSFFVDNYTCGAYNPGTTSGSLTVHGSLAQQYRGSVATVSGTSTYGYLKKYNYDYRLATILPPYMFDLQSTQWTTVRETLCSPGSGTCSNT